MLQSMGLQSRTQLSNQAAIVRDSYLEFRVSFSLSNAILERFHPNGLSRIADLPLL